MIKCKGFQRNLILSPLLSITLLAVISFIFKDFHISVIGGYSLFVLIAFLFVGVTTHGRLSLTNTQLSGIVLAFVATIMVFSPFSDTSVRTVSVIYALDIAMLYIAISKPEEREIRQAFRLLVGAAIIMSLYAVLVAAFPAIYFNGVKHILPADTQEMIELGFKYKYGVAIGGESIIIDYYAFWGIVISLNTLIILGKKCGYQWFCILVFVLCTLAIIVQNRKAELLVSALVVIFLLLSNVNISRRKDKWKQYLIFAFVAIAGIAGIIFLMSRGYLARYQSFLTLLQFNQTSSNNVDISSGRLKLWKKAFDLFTEHPFFGIGWGNFRSHLTDTYNPFNQGQLSNAHNNYLQLLCETGIVGLILFVGPMFYILARTFSTVRWFRVSGTDRHITRIALSTSLSFQLFYLIISFIDPVWYKMFTWPFYGIAVILLVFAEKDRKELQLQFIEEH